MIWDQPEIYHLSAVALSSGWRGKPRRHRAACELQNNTLIVRRDKAHQCETFILYICFSSRWKRCLSRQWRKSWWGAGWERSLLMAARTFFSCRGTLRSSIFTPDVSHLVQFMNNHWCLWYPRKEAMFQADTFELYLSLWFLRCLHINSMIFDAAMIRFLKLTPSTWGLYTNNLGS